MKTLPHDLTQRLLFILHRGLTEIRNLALRDGNEQIADLADALEILPRHVLHCSDEEMELLRHVLKNYQLQYPESSYAHVAFLEDSPAPENY